MTAPDDTGDTEKVTDWTDTAASLRELFAGKAGTGTGEAQGPGPAAPEPTPLLLPATGGDTAPAGDAPTVHPNTDGAAEARAAEVGAADHADGTVDSEVAGVTPAAPRPVEAAPAPAAVVDDAPETRPTPGLDTGRESGPDTVPDVETGSGSEGAAPVTASEPVQPPGSAQDMPEPTEPPPAPLPAPVAAPGPGALASAAEESAAEASLSGFSNDLEELVYAPTTPATGPVVGDVLDGYHLNEDLGRGWFIASPVASGPSVEVYARPGPLWAQLAPHRALPRFLAAGALHALEPVGGEPVRAPLPTADALAYLTELTRLLFALDRQGFAVVDLDPDAPRVTPQGVRLRFPPRVARSGEATEVAVREGYTPPEVLAGSPVDARSGVYLLGALLYRWLTGQNLPPEGPSPAVLGSVTAAGVPQLLRGMLAPLQERLGPGQVLTALNTLTAARLPAYGVAAATTVGLNPDRPINEDSYGFTWRQVGVHGASTLALRACVSDGMGGMAAGEVASAAAVGAFLDSGSATLTEMVWEANAAVLAAMAGRDGGCTFSGVELRGDRLELGHVGDTRVYVRQGGVVRQLSRDHSYVAAMVASGQMTAQEAQDSPERNKVLRSLGSLRVPQDHYVQTLDAPLTLAAGDRVLLVSDGVWGEVPDAALIPLLETLPVQALVDRLIALALEAGAPDNATALVIERVG